MLRPFMLPHSLACSHRTSQSQTETSLGVAQGPPAWGWIVPWHLDRRRVPGTALLPTQTHLGCSKMDEDVPEGKTLGLINSYSVWPVLDTPKLHRAPAIPNSSSTSHQTWLVHVDFQVQ